LKFAVVRRGLRAHSMPPPALALPAHSPKSRIRPGVPAEATLSKLL